MKTVKVTKVVAFVIIVLLVVVAKQVVYAQEQNDVALAKFLVNTAFTGCERFINNPESFLDIDLYKIPPESPFWVGYLSTFCNPNFWELRFGRLETSNIDTRFGLGRNVKYSYGTFCYTFWELSKRLLGNPVNIQKLIILLAHPVLVIDKANVEIPGIVVGYVAGGVPKTGLTGVLLLDYDINIVQKSNVKPTKLYSDFYRALFTGDVDSAYKAVTSISDNEVEIVKTACENLIKKRR